MTTSGRFEGRTHFLPVRIYYQDTDAAGIVYHANYLNYAERGRSEFLRLLGIDKAMMAQGGGLAFAVRGCEMDFLRPARLDDLIEVQTRLVAVQGASIRLEQPIRRDGDELVRLTLRIAVVSRALRPLRLPPAMRAQLQSFVSPTLQER